MRVTDALLKLIFTFREILKLPNLRDLLELRGFLELNASMSSKRFYSSQDEL